MQKSSVLDTEQEPQTHASQLLEVVLCSVYIVFVVKRIQKKTLTMACHYMK